MNFLKSHSAAKLIVEHGNLETLLQRAGQSTSGVYCVPQVRLHTSAYVSRRQHTSAYVSIRQHTSAYVSDRRRVLRPTGPRFACDLLALLVQKCHN